MLAATPVTSPLTPSGPPRAHCHTAIATPPARIAASPAAGLRRPHTTPAQRDDDGRCPQVVRQQQRIDDRRHHQREHRGHDPTPKVTTRCVIRRWRSVADVRKNGTEMSLTNTTAVESGMSRPST